MRPQQLHHNTPHHHTTPSADQCRQQNSDTTNQAAPIHYPTLNTPPHPHPHTNTTTPTPHHHPTTAAATEPGCVRCPKQGAAPPRRPHPTHTGCLLRTQQRAEPTNACRPPPPPGVPPGD